MGQKISAWDETKKALKWILRSGVVTVSLSALVSLVMSLQSAELDIRAFLYGVVIIVIQAVINVIDFYNHERK